jgi:serine phosphatase RsbU (regulator of sigma subunit)
VQGEAEVHTGDRIRIGPVLLAVSESELDSPDYSESSTRRRFVDSSIEAFQAHPSRIRQDRLLAALYEAGQMLARRMDLEEVFESVLDLTGRFITSSRTLVLEYQPGRKKHPVVAHRVYDGKFKHPLMLSEQMMEEIMLKGRTFRTRDAASDERWDPDHSIAGLGVHAAMGVPLFDDEEILGAIYMDARHPEVHYSEEDLRLLSLLGSMVAVKITSSRHEREAKVLEHLQNELAVAERIQMNLLPRSLPEFPGYEVAAHLHPCERVGGDLYDVRRLEDGRIWITLGDVTGHGIPAAILMAHVMMGLRFLEERESDPQSLISQLETKLDRHIEDWQFVTLFVAILDPGTGHLVYTNAGQWPPVLIGSGGCSRLETTGMPVAIFPGVQRREAGECCLAPGDALLAFSDGVPETLGGKGAHYESRMSAFVSSIKERIGQLSADEVGRELLDDVATFRGRENQEDDLTLVVVKRRL